MINIKINRIMSVLIFCVFILGAFLASNVSGNDGSLYTAQNIWYEIGKEKSLWCINYKTGMIIPAGTQVKNVKIIKSFIARRTNPQGQVIFFETVKNQKEYWVKFVSKYHPGKTIDEYKN